MKRVLAFSYSQADWGLWRPILRGLSPEFCVDVFTVNEAHRDRVHADLHDVRHRQGVTYAMEIEHTPMASMFSSATESITALLSEGTHQYDAVLLLGDRLYELAAATVCKTLHYTVHHLFAGDVSGCLDDRYRDAVSHLCDHAYCFSVQAFVRASMLSTHTHTAFRCHHVSMPPEPINEEMVQRMEEKHDTRRDNYILARIHPETTRQEPVQEWVREIVELARQELLDVYWLPPNADDGAQQIMDAWNDAWLDTSRVYQLPVMSRDQYLGVMKHAKYVIGNSSSFIHDAPLVGCEDRVNLLGHRQADRTPMDSTGDDVVVKLKENIHAS